MQEKIGLSTLRFLVAPPSSPPMCFSKFILLDWWVHLCQPQPCGESQALRRAAGPSMWPQIVTLLFLRNHSYRSPDFVLLLTTVKTLSVTQITKGSLLLSMILTNKLVNWSSVPNRLDSTEWGGVSTIASSPERDPCQNLCSLLDCFVL